MKIGDKFIAMPFSANYLSEEMVKYFNQVCVMVETEFDLVEFNDGMQYSWDKSALKPIN